MISDQIHLITCIANKTTFRPEHFFGSQWFKSHMATLKVGAVPCELSLLDDDPDSDADDSESSFDDCDSIARSAALSAKFLSTLRCDRFEFHLFRLLFVPFGLFTFRPDLALFMLSVHFNWISVFIMVNEYSMVKCMLFHICTYI